MSCQSQTQRLNGAVDRAGDGADDAHAHANHVYEVVKTHKYIPLVIHCIMDFDQRLLDQI